ncbi:long-chain fatty acid transport protein [Vibrio cholerae]|nr:long-chain fatty acid transport protein [Vibrio cholerae]
MRAGLAFDEQAGKATLSIPDSDRLSSPYSAQHSG